MSTKTNAELFETVMSDFSKKVLTQLQTDGPQVIMREFFDPYACLLDNTLFRKVLLRIIIAMAHEANSPSTTLADVLIQFIILGREMEKLSQAVEKNDVVLSELETWFQKYGNTNLEDGN
jgi:hypothetical protein